MPTLTWLLRLNAFVLLTAVVPMFFPASWMAYAHETLGLGEMVQGRLNEYLTRSAAACYTLHGIVIWLLSTDVERYRPLIRGVYVAHLLFAATMFGIDCYAGMPWWWTVVEPGTIALVATGMLILLHRTTQTARNT